MLERADPPSRTCCSFSFEAVTATPAEARHLLRRCLAQAGWPHVEAERFVVAVNEAVSNAVQHAYGPDESASRRTVRMTVTVEATPSGRDRDRARQVRVVVEDQGRWPGHSDDIGRLLAKPISGFGLMRALTSRAVIDLHRAGTRVVLVSEPWAAW